MKTVAVLKILGFKVVCYAAKTTGYPCDNWLPNKVEPPYLGCPLSSSTTLLHCFVLMSLLLFSPTHSSALWWLLHGSHSLPACLWKFPDTNLLNSSSVCFIGFPPSWSLIPSFPWNSVPAPFLFLVYTSFLDKPIQTLGLELILPSDDFPTFSTTTPFFGSRALFNTTENQPPNLHGLSQINGTTIGWIQKPSPTVCPKHHVFLPHGCPNSEKSRHTNTSSFRLFFFTLMALLGRLHLWKPSSCSRTHLEASFLCKALCNFSRTISIPP